MTSYSHGWYQLAFERDLTENVVPVTFGTLPLMAVRTESGLRVFDAVCPHRGANLARGARLEGSVVVCPFHAYPIGLGQPSKQGFCAREYASLVRDGIVFFRLSDRDQPDFPAAFASLTGGHAVVPGFELTARTSIEMVMENGFDNAHFRSVHGVLNIPSLAMSRGEFGQLLARGAFEIPRSGWYEPPSDRTDSHKPSYVAHAFSPGLVITELNGEPPFRYRIMTTATPAAEPGCSLVRLTLILPNGPAGEAPDPGFAGELLRLSRNGLEQDCAIWDHLDLGHTPQLTGHDDAVVAFADFCRPFRAEAAA